MLDPLLSLTSLPNLHPALVHFPIALLPLAFALDVAFAVMRRVWLERAAAGLWGIAALAAWVALWSGEEAAESVFNAPAAVEATLVEHGDLAHWASWLALLVAAVRGYLAWRDRRRAQLAPDALRLGMLAAAALCLVLLVMAADHGGALVYQHGVGVAADAVMVSPSP